MHVGNTWTYVYQLGEEEREETYCIVETRVVGQDEYLVFKSSFAPFFPLRAREVVVRNTENNDVVVRFRDQDVLYYEFSNSTLDSMRVAHVDSVPGYQDGIDFVTYLYSIDDTVTTPAGTFYDCCRFTASIAQVIDTTVEVWFAPDVGPVCFRRWSAGNIPSLLRSAVVDGRHYGPTGLSPASWGAVKAQDQGRRGDR